jgi:hypothetical protein
MIYRTRGHSFKCRWYNTFIQNVPRCYENKFSITVNSFFVYYHFFVDIVVLLIFWYHSVNHVNAHLFLFTGGLFRQDPRRSK